MHDLVRRHLVHAGHRKPVRLDRSPYFKLKGALQLECGWFGDLGPNGHENHPGALKTAASVVSTRTEQIRIARGEAWVWFFLSSTKNYDFSV